MGIYANLMVEPGCGAANFSTIDDAVLGFYQRLNCTTHNQEEIIRKYCETSLEHTPAGYRVPGKALGAHVWWDVKKPDPLIWEFLYFPNQVVVL